jgi:heme-degrading monooxygenase HmoA
LIVTLFPFPLGAGGAEDLAEVFRRHRILELAREVEGCRAVWLAADSDESDTAQAYAVGLWDDEVAYQRWIDHPERRAATDDIQALLRVSGELDLPGQVLNVLHSAD